MRIHCIAATVAALFIGTPASAQYFDSGGVNEAAQRIYRSCVNISETSGMTDIRAACACITGYLGGTFNDRDFEAAAILLRVGELVETGAPQSAIDAEVVSLFQRGYAEQDVQRIAAMIEQASPRGDAVCAQFQQRGSV